jgi:hypothetical protein
MVKDRKTKKDVSFDVAYSIDSDRLLQLDLMAELIKKLFKALCMNLSKAAIMNYMNHEQPTGDYILEKETFGRLVAAGFRLEESDFAAVVDLSDYLRS